VSQIVAALQAGFLLAAAYNPVVAGAFSALAAALCGRRGKRGRTALGIAVLAVGWTLGDGMRVIASARDLSDGAGALLPALSVELNWVAVAVWAVVGAVVGYVLPAITGAYVGRRVTFGTGWLAAAVVSATCSGVIAALIAGIV